MGVKEIAVICAASVNSIVDMKRREILFVPTILFLCAGAVYGLVNGCSLLFILTGLLPGASLALLSLASRGAVGFGDAVMIGAAGVWIGLVPALITLAAALGIQAAISAVYIFAGGKRKDLPFVPAILAGYLLSIAFGF